MKLTPDEQIYMVNGQSFFCMGELPDKHIPRIQMLDGGTGLNYEQLFGDMLTKANLPGKETAAFRNVLNNFFQPDSLDTTEELELTVETPDAIDWHNRAVITLRYDGESPYSWGVNTSIKEIYETPELKDALHRFMDAHGLPWENVLTTYEYTAKDSLGLMLKNAGCPDEVIVEFAEILRKLRYLKK